MLTEAYRDKPVVVTGGLGFIGSNLAIRLADAGAAVTVIDPEIVGCGGNSHNIQPVKDRVEIIARDIGDAHELQSVIGGAKVIFNLAGEISHIHSMEFPERDLLINTVSQMRFLQACARYNPGVRIVYAGTRQVYGKPDYLPMDENHPVRPIDFNGVHKYAANMYHLMLSRTGLIDGIVLRLTNVYGPRMALSIPCQGFLSTFLRRVLTGHGLEIYGDGKQLRDPVFIEDAVEAFLCAGAAGKVTERTFNLGGPQALPLSTIAECCARSAGGQNITVRPFPEDRAAIDIGSYFTDSKRFDGTFGWKPEIRFADGIDATIRWYRNELAHYLDPDNPVVQCGLPEHAGVEHRLFYTPV